MGVMLTTEIGNKPLRWLEMVVLFVLIPALLLLDPVIRYAALMLSTIYALGIMAIEKPRFESSRPSPPQYLPIRIPVIVGLIFLFSWLAYPDNFLSMPQKQPELWLLIMIFYPPLSALPQEFIYRRFYFSRYRALFPSVSAMLASNVLLFTFMHVMYGNLVAIGMSMLGGLLFAVSYQQTGRLLPVWIEHAVYGMAIFTSGLGHFFYNPIL